MPPRSSSTTNTTAAAPTRREFAAAALAAGAAALLPGCASGGRGATSAAPAAAAAAAAADPNAPVADALFAAVVARHGRWLDEEQRKNVRQGIERNLRLADRLRAAALPNSADPYSVCYAPAAPTR